jgi:hypothetical protein
VSHETGRPTVVDPSEVISRDAFGNFIQAVLQDYEKSGQSEWENATLPRFLDALAAVSSARVRDTADQETASWTLFAKMVVAATGYE